MKGCSRLIHPFLRYHVLPACTLLPHFRNHEIPVEIALEIMGTAPFKERHVPGDGLVVRYETRQNQIKNASVDNEQPGTAKLFRGTQHAAHQYIDK